MLIKKGYILSKHRKEYVRMKINHELGDFSRDPSTDQKM